MIPWAILAPYLYAAAGEDDTFIQDARVELFRSLGCLPYRKGAARWTSGRSALHAVIVNGHRAACFTLSEYHPGFARLRTDISTAPQEMRRALSVGARTWAPKFELTCMRDEISLLGTFVEGCAGASMPRLPFALDRDWGWPQSEIRAWTGYAWSRRAAAAYDALLVAVGGKWSGREASRLIRRLDLPAKPGASS